MDSYERIYNLLTEVKTPDERYKQVWSSLTTDRRTKDLNRADYDMEKIKKARDPNNPLNRESPPGGDVESRIRAGRGDRNPDDVAQYIAASHGMSKRTRDLEKRDRLAADAERTQTEIGKRLRGEPIERKKPSTKPGLVGRVKKLISRVTGR
tara:strand:+ start:310 stop:765 length:456 start_codon:yes stop_codon:yes gene_type:complete